MAIVVTTTSVTQVDAEKHGLTLSSVIDALNGQFLDEKPTKKGLEEGIWVFEADEKNTAFLVYTVEDVNLDKAYKTATEEEKRACWEDGYKRRQVNRPAHEFVTLALGLKEPSKTAAKIDEAKAETERVTIFNLAYALAEIASSPEHIVNMTGGQVSLGVAETAFRLAKGGEGTAAK